MLSCSTRAAGSLICLRSTKKQRVMAVTYPEELSNAHSNGEADGSSKALNPPAKNRAIPTTARGVSHNLWSSHGTSHAIQWHLARMSDGIKHASSRRFSTAVLPCTNVRHPCWTQRCTLATKREVSLVVATRSRKKKPVCAQQSVRAKRTMLSASVSVVIKPLHFTSDTIYMYCSTSPNQRQQINSFDSVIHMQESPAPKRSFVGCSSRPSCDSPNTSRRLALGASDVCLVSENPTCSVPAL